MVSGFQDLLCRGFLGGGLVAMGVCQVVAMLLLMCSGWLLGVFFKARLHLHLLSNVSLI